MRAKSWNKIVILLTVLPVLLLIIINYIIDPFDVFQSKFLKHPYQLNERYNKIVYLNHNHNKYNGYMLGSSRMGTTSPQIISNYLPGAHFYNLSVAGCTQYDNLLFIKYLLQNNAKIDYLYLQIDMTDVDGFYPSPANYSARHHPLATNSSAFIFHMNYLTLLPIKNLKGKLNNNFNSGYLQHVKYDINNSGRWYVQHLEQQIQNDHKGYIKSQASLNEQHSQRALAGKFINQNISALEELISIAKNNSIQIYAFIAPHNYNLMNKFNIDSYIEYLDKIADITEYWDFSGYNTITLDNSYYYESSHYRSIMSELIAKVIFTDYQIPNFGLYVTPDNKQQHLAQRINNIQSFSAKELKSSYISPSDSCSHQSA